MKKKQVIKAITIGISASILLNPVVALAEELDEDDSKTEEIVADDSKEGADILAGAEGSSDAATTYEGVEEKIGDAATDIAIASGCVEEAAKVPDTEFGEGQKALEEAADKVGQAKKDVEDADKASSDQKTAIGNLETYTETATENLTDANTAISEGEKAAANAVSKDGTVNAATSTEAEAAQAVQDIRSDINTAEGKLKEAEQKLSDVQQNLDKAAEEYSAVLADKTSSEQAISDAKQKVAEAESALSNARKEVDDNYEVIQNLEAEANRLSIYNQISELQEELSEMNTGDAEYPDKAKTLSELIVKCYLFENEKIDAGTEIVFGENTERYETGYEEDEDGNLNPSYKTVTYKTVTFISGGEETTWKIDYGYDEEGTITISEKEVTAEKSEVTILPHAAIELTDENHLKYEATSTSHVIYKNPDDEDEGFYAIDTADGPMAPEEEILPEVDVEIRGKDADLNNCVITYIKIAPVEGAKETKSYELTKDGNIAEITSKEFETEYEISTEIIEEGKKNSNSEARDYVQTRIQQLYDEYGDSFDDISSNTEFSWFQDGSYLIIYNLVEIREETRSLPVTQAVYKSKEYIDRTSVYVDENGKEFEKKADTVTVYIDPENKKLGFYAADTDTAQVLGEEYSEPENYSIYERDDQGNAKRTTTDHSERYVISKAYTRETYSKTVEIQSSTSYRYLEDGEDLYDVLNSIQKKDRTTTVKLKGADSSVVSVDFGNPRWYEDAEKNFAALIESTGSCVLEVTEHTPVTSDVTGIVERENPKYNVTTGTYVIESYTGSSDDVDEAYRLKDEIIAAAKKIGACRIIRDRVDEKENPDGTTEYVYDVEYELTLSFDKSIQDITRRTTVYRDIMYINSAVQVKDIYDVSENDKSLLTTDEAFKKAIAEKVAAYQKANEAKKKIEDAIEKYVLALESVQEAKIALDNLVEAGVPETVIGEAQAKYNTAQENLKKAVEDKSKADSSLTKARAALTSAESKLNQIRGRSSSGGTSESGGTSGVVPSNVADAGTTSSSSVDTPTAAAGPGVTGTTSTVQAAAPQPEGSVLGAVRYGKAKVGKADSSEEKAVTDSEDVKQDTENADISSGAESGSDNSTVTDNSKSDDRKGNASQAKTIKDENTPLVATPITTTTNPLGWIIFAVAGIGSVIAGVFVYLEYIKNRH